ncbi:MAG: hypothetical protein Q9160_007792 [Pyrenula sp. 1 TL-2023]
MGSLEKPSHFKKIQGFGADYCPAHFSQYESEKTGMRVVVVDQKGPKVYGAFVLATEIHDDSGSPHTLEHLVFMGSKSYRYKGFLDKLANRMYADGTNAWTATDHTGYTVETAGWEGFARILPVYLEHIILPTLTDEGCLTEVHHIDGSGQDAGVVYSEMQGRENDAGELMSLRNKRLLYPEGSGFRSETGGLLERLRVLTADRIREFHRVMYQPKNLCLVVTGDVNHSNLFQILSDFEISILSSIPSPESPFKRPWVESTKTPPLARSTIERVEFPEEDEDYGQISCTFLGPSCNDVLLSGALNVVLEYLAGSSASILDNTLVEREQLSSGVYYTVQSRPDMEIEFVISSVETAKLEQVERRFSELLHEAVSKPLNMPFLHDCIARQVRKWKWATEATPDWSSQAIINDFLFGKRDGTNLKDLASLDEYKTLLQWSENEWRGFIKKWFSDAYRVSVLGVPSAKLSEKLKVDEQARIEVQKKSLGDEGLHKKQEALDRAKAENDKPIPTELLGQFKVPPVESIHFVKILSAKAGTALQEGKKPTNQVQDVIDRDQSVPLYLQFKHIESNFVRIRLLITTQDIPLEIRPLLAVYVESFFTLPVERNGQVIDFEQVVMELERDTVTYNLGEGSKLGCGEDIRITFQVEPEKYAATIQWLQELLWHAVLDTERLIAVTNRLLADVPDSKRSGDDMLGAIHIMTHLAPESIIRSQSTLVKALYLKQIKQLLKTNPNQVKSQLTQLRTSLCQLPNFRILIVSDVTKLPHPVSSWQPFTSAFTTTTPPSKTPSTLQPITSRLTRLSPAGLSPGTSTSIIPMPTIDSSYAYALTRGPTSHSDPLIPALSVAIAYFNALEGPLWVAVRGTGLAYGTKISHDITSGFLYLDIYRSPDAYKAFEASRAVVENHINGATQFDPLTLEGAISSIVLAFVEDEATLDQAAQTDFIREVVRGLPEDYVQSMLRKVRGVTVQEIRSVLKELVWGLFEPGRADVLVTCAVGLGDGIKSGLEKMGFKPQVRDLNSFQDDYGLKAVDGGSGSGSGSDDDDGDDDDMEDGEEEGGA